MGMKETVTRFGQGNVSYHLENQRVMRDRSAPARRTRVSVKEIASVICRAGKPVQGEMKKLRPE